MKKRKFMTIVLAFALALVMSLGLIGCNDKTTQKPSNNGEVVTPGSGEDVKPGSGEDVKPGSEGNDPIVDEEEKTDDYSSIAYKVKENEVFSAEAGYTPLQIFGRLNWTFKQKKDWQAVYTGNVNTILPQDITTLKQYRDGILISTDISKSLMLNTAKEFCYIPSADRVMWREASTTKDKEYNGFNTPWKDELAGNMKISGDDGFKATNGIPAYELSVYVFRPETISSADDVLDNNDGTFKVTYHLDPTITTAEDGTVTGAAAYYSKQMKFTSGGMTNGATFNEITVSFTFNANWETLKMEINEAYQVVAPLVGPTDCTGTGTTIYSYDTTKPLFDECDHYETFFKGKLQ